MARPTLYPADDIPPIDPFTSEMMAGPTERPICLADASMDEAEAESPNLNALSEAVIATIEELNKADVLAVDAEIIAIAVETIVPRTVTAAVVVVAETPMRLVASAIAANPDAAEAPVEPARERLLA